MAGKAGKRIQDAVRSLERAANPFTKATETPLAAAATSFLKGTPCQRRLYATESQHQAWHPSPTVPLTIHRFPSYEPARLEAWSSRHLNLPLRRDLLHLAVVYEGDNTRQGTASSKTRWDVRGSGRKLYAQKGMGRARVGDAQSPLRRGGGKTFGPHPRDFGTRLNRKVYDLAWRTALSYRYRRGELVVCQDGMELPLPDAFERLLLAGEIAETELVEGFKGQWARQMLERNEWGKQHGRSTFITASKRDNLFDALDLIPNYGRALDVDEVDVKDLLETGRLVVERDALKEMIVRHQSDLVSMTWVQGVSIPKAPETGKIVVE